MIREMSSTSGSKPTAEASSPELARRLSAWNLMLLVAGTAIGGGIFLTPSSIAQALPAGLAHPLGGL